MEKKFIGSDFLSTVNEIIYIINQVVKSSVYPGQNSVHAEGTEFEKKRNKARILTGKMKTVKENVVATEKQPVPLF